MKKVSLKGIEGRGFAEMIEVGDIRECIGMVFFERSIPTEELKCKLENEACTYEGVLYDGTKQSVLTFPVVVTDIKPEGDTCVRFTATHDPYKEAVSNVAEE